MTLRSLALPEERRGRLKALLAAGRKVRAVEAHSGIAGLIARNAAVSVGGASVGFDAIWISSFTSSASRGLPDVELETLEHRLALIDEVLTVADLPLIVDADTGGEAAKFEYLCGKLEAMGVSAVVVEDKRCPKRNSLVETASHLLEDPLRFVDKIQRGKAVLRSADFLVFARIESLIANLGVEDALERARHYLVGGADGILIHSKDPTPEPVFQFLAGYDALCREVGQRKPVACVPTTYPAVASAALFERGIDVVVFANQLLRAAHRAMMETCESILRHDRSLEAGALCSSTHQIHEIVGFHDVTARDRALPLAGLPPSLPPDTAQELGGRLGPNGAGILPGRPGRTPS